MYYQLEWAKSKEIYSSILIRFIAVLIISFLVLYLFLLLIQFGFNLFKRVPEINSSFILFYPMSLFHLGWYQYVSDKLIPFFSLFLYAVFVSSICFSVYQVWVKSKEEEIRAAQRLKPAELFRRVNYSFSGYLREIHSKLVYNLFYPVRFAWLVIYPTTWLLVLMQIIIIVKYSVYGVYRPVLFPVYISATFLMPVLLIQGLRSLFSSVPFIGKAISFLICIVYYLLTLFHITEDAPLDYSVLQLNVDLLTYNQSYILLFERLKTDSYIMTFLCFLLAAAIIIVSRNKWAAFKPDKPFLAAALCIGAYAGLLFTPLKNMDQLRTFYYSYKDYSIQQKSIKQAEKLLKMPFPYMQKPDSALNVLINHRVMPNIFLVCLESCNGRMIEKKTENEQEITPFFNSIIKEGVYAEHFYANSVQTARGFFAILTGILPGFRKKEFTSMPDLNLRCLPDILSEYGYESYFIKAYHDLNYDNTGEFMKKAGYHNVWSMTDDKLDEEEKANRWGWGLQDDYFYRKLFRMIDLERERQQFTSVNKPLFITTFNVSNHMMFQNIPKNQRYLYPDAGPSDFVNNFQNSMFVSDSCLRIFFDELNKREWCKNSIIIVTGDHSFPSGEHTRKNEKGAWEEIFRTPLLIIWKGHLKPSRLQKNAFSQVDIMPTIFDLLDISPAHHSIGKSILESGDREPVLMTQPYDGIYLATVEYPFKYVKKLKGNLCFLFDLQEDPQESQNLINSSSYTQARKKLQKNLMKIMVNQALLEKNRIWPASN